MTTNCPVCACECTDAPLNVYTVDQAASHFCPPWRDADRHRRLAANIRGLWQGDECRIRRCGACGFAFGDPFVGGDEEFDFVASAARYEPPSWSKAFRSAYGRVRADATDSRTLSAKIYRVRNKRVRAPLLAGAGMLALPRLLPHLRELRLGGSFAMLGTVPAD